MSSRHRAQRRVVIAGGVLAIGAYYLLEKVLNKNLIEKFYVFTDILNSKIREKYLANIKNMLIRDTLARVDVDNLTVLEIGSGCGRNFDYYRPGRSLFYTVLEEI
jgi:hypothetical protein